MFGGNVEERQFWVSRPSQEDDIEIDVKRTVYVALGSNLDRNRVQWQSREYNKKGFIKAR